MPNLQRFEGSDLEKLLDQVRSEAGPDAAIVEANKLRKGGVGGFFAKECFEVVVDLDTRHRALGPGRTAEARVEAAIDDTAIEDAAEDSDEDEDDDTFRPMSLMDIAERVSASERTAARRGTATGAKGPDAPVGGRGGEPGGAGTGFAFNSVLESAVRKAAGLAPGDARPVAWDEPATAGWHPGRLDGPEGPHRRPDGADGPTRPGDPEGPSPAGPERTGATAGGTGPVDPGATNHLLPALAASADPGGLDPSPAEMAERLAGADRLRGAATLAGRSAGLNGARPAGAGLDGQVHGHGHGHGQSNGHIGHSGHGGHTIGHGQQAMNYLEVAEVNVHPHAPAAAPEGLDLVVHQLSRVGIPSDLLALSANLAQTGANVPAFTVHVELARILERLPQPPALPRSRGSVLAVVGPRKAALRLARDLAQQLEVDPAAIVLAAPDAGKEPEEDLVLRTAAEAADQRRSWLRRKRPTLVVLDSPIGRRSPAWAAAVLDELEPAMTWGVVEAARKPEDVEAWAGALGGVDALEVRRLDETTSPASVLHTGIPVAVLDGMTATTGRWVSVLSRHLSLAA